MKNIWNEELTLETLYEDQDLVLRRGIWIVRGDEAAEIQEGLDDEDPSKSVEFGDEHDYWLFDDASNPPIPLFEVDDIPSFYFEQN
ncbi:MAG: hypothetical protein G8D88_13900 [gamma proteobacterium symbiont of Ctena orbiculata]